MAHQTHTACISKQAFFFYINFMKIHGFLGCIIALYLITYNHAVAQYHLDEIGMQAGGGTNVPLAAPATLSPSYAYNACAFYTRYRCGKKDGFLMEVGMRGFQIPEKATPNSLLAPDNNIPMRFHFLYSFLGLHYKIRFKDYHRDNEVAFLIGTKGDFRFTSLHNSDVYKLQRYNSDAYRKVYGFIPAASLSLWIRKAWAPRKTFFIRPGIDYAFKPTVKTVSNLQFENLHLFLNFGFIFWNNL